MTKILALAFATIVFPMSAIYYLLIKITHKDILDYWSPEVPVFHKYQIAKYAMRRFDRCVWFVIAVGFIELIVLTRIFCP